MTWNEYKKLNVPDKSTDYIKGEFLKSLIATSKNMKTNFQLKIDYNKFSKASSASFESKVDWLLTKGGAKYSKSGIPAV